MRPLLTRNTLLNPFLQAVSHVYEFNVVDKGRVLDDHELIIGP
jgi:hypothetical protein